MPPIARIAVSALIAVLAGPALAQGGAAAPSPSIAGAAPVQTANLPWLSVAQLRARYADKASRYLTIKGVEIHYKDEGPRNAPVLYMVHGSVSTLRTWDRIAERLKGRYRIVRFDVPGYGLSGRISDEAARSVQPVDIAEGLLDHLGIAKVTFVGVSSGGTMGMYLAAKRPDIVQRLVLSNTPSDPVDTSHLVQPESFVKAQASAKATGFQDQVFWNEYLSFFAGDPARISPATRAQYYDFNRRVPEKHPIALVARIGDGKVATVEMAKVRAPVFLIWGGHDPLLPESAVVAITRYLSGAQISKVIMPDVGHYPPLEVPDRFAQLLVAYVEAGTPAR